MISKAVQNTRSNFEEFVYENPNMSEDDYDFDSASQKLKSWPNRARRNMDFYGMGNYEYMDENLDTIKLKIPNFQGRNDHKIYLERKR